MFGFGKKRDKIRVEFVRAEEEEPFTVQELTADQIPDTFRPDMTLEMAGRRWVVLHADPTDKRDFQASGKLRLILAELQVGIPEDALYTVPTIENALCALREVASLHGMLVIHEDDWRRVEFVSDMFIADIEAELASIREILETKRKAEGFTTLHVRRLIESPIRNGSVPLGELKELLGISSEFAGLAVGGCAAEGGFAFETNNRLQFYGVATGNGNVAFLCLTDTDELEGKLSGIAQRFHLVCVDWCQAHILSS